MTTSTCFFAAVGGTPSAINFSSSSVERPSGSTSPRRNNSVIVSRINAQKLFSTKRLTAFAQRVGLNHQPVENCYQLMKNADDEFNARKAPLLAGIAERASNTDQLLSIVRTDPFMVTRTGTSTLNYVLHDYYSVSAITDQYQSIIERYGYDAFGKTRFMTAAFGSRASSNYSWEHLYGAYRYDTESGLYQVRFRSLHPLLGRWTSRDPIGLLGGANLYAYVANKSINYVDALGLRCGCEEDPTGSDVELDGITYGQLGIEPCRKLQYLQLKGEILELAADLLDKLSVEGGVEIEGGVGVGGSLGITLDQEGFGISGSVGLAKGFSVEVSPISVNFSHTIAQGGVGSYSYGNIEYSLGNLSAKAGYGPGLSGKATNLLTPDPGYKLSTTWVVGASAKFTAISFSASF